MSWSSTVRSPRLEVLANGAPIVGALGAHVTSTNYHGANSFRIEIALSGEPAMGGAFWADIADAEIDVRIALHGLAVSLVLGLVDHVAIDPVQGVAVLTGRDRTALLIEARTQETFANRTASEVAAMLAERHGLQADVVTTTTPVGRYWQLEHDRITLDQFCRASTEWDLLVGLASREGFDVWVTGDVLHFRPPPLFATQEAVLRAAATPEGPVNILSVRLERSLTLARDIEVVVKSWNSRMGRSFSETARARRKGSQHGQLQRYHYIYPDLTPDAALQIAQRKLSELSRHERVIIAEMPGDVVLDAHAMVRLEGTGTAFDQDYRVDEIVRSFDWRAGFLQTVRARNISPGVEVQ